MGGTLLDAVMSHWWAGVIGPALLALPRCYRRLAVIANNEWHLSQCNAREAALTKEVTTLRTAVERAAQNQAFGSASSASDTNRTTLPETH